MAFTVREAIAAIRAAYQQPNNNPTFFPGVRSNLRFDQDNGLTATGTSVLFEGSAGGLLGNRNATPLHPSSEVLIAFRPCRFDDEQAWLPRELHKLRHAAAGRLHAALS